MNGTGTGAWSTEEPVASQAVSQGTNKGVTLSETELKLLEDTGSATYTVVLTAAPTADVIVTPAVANKNSTDTKTYATVSGSLTFTTSNWQTPQTVTVTANDNDDTTFNTSARTLTVSHTISSSGDSDYNSIAANALLVTVKMQDDDLLNAEDNSIVLDTAQNAIQPELNLSVKETDNTFTYGIKLKSDPGNNTTTTITPCSKNESVLKVTSNPLSFTGGISGNWSTKQEVTVSIVGRGEAVIVHWLNGGCETVSQAVGANASSSPPQAASFKIVVDVEAAAVDEEDKTPYNSRLPEVAKQWLARPWSNGVVPGGGIHR